MQVISVSVRPVIESVEPLLGLGVLLGYVAGRELPISIAAVVKCADKKILGSAHLSHQPRETIRLEADDTGVNPKETRLETHLLLPVTRRQLDHIENLRNSNRKHDVELGIELEIQCLAAKAVVAHLRKGPSVQIDRSGTMAESVVVVDPPGAQSFHSMTSNMWVLSGGGDRTFLERQIFHHSEAVTVSSSDWLHDYASAWNSARYLVLEVPEPDGVLPAASPLAPKMRAAIEAARHATEQLSRGEWTSVCEDLREVWEVLRAMKAEVGDLLKRDGYTQSAVDELLESVNHQFQFASKFLHRTDKAGKINPEIVANKEDAHLVYSLAVTLFNLLSRKAARLGT